MIQSTNAVKITKGGVVMTKRIIIYGLLFALVIGLGVLSISCTNDATAEVSNEFNILKEDSEKPLAQIFQRLDTIVGMLDQIILKLDENYDKAGVPKTWQKVFYATGDDGDLQTGIDWPNPRFTDNNDGTVTDNLTGLIWLLDADPFGVLTWTEALAACNSLAADGIILDDGSVAGDWRLPNVRELHSLIDYGQGDPAVTNTNGTGQWSEGDPFFNVSNNAYWTSTSCQPGSTWAWYVHIAIGHVFNRPKYWVYRAWPVRDDK